MVVTVPEILSEKGAVPLYYERRARYHETIEGDRT
jgi:hypothetical protein